MQLKQLCTFYDNGLMMTYEQLAIFVFSLDIKTQIC